MFDQPTQYEHFEELQQKLGKMMYETDEMIIDKLRQDRLEEIKKEKEQ